MRHFVQSTVLSTAFFVAVGLPVGTQAAASPVSETVTVGATSLGQPSPYQEGFERGLKEGYARGMARALNHCRRDYGLPWPEVGQGAYKIGYSDGFKRGYRRGFDDGIEKYCRPG
jgi:flagellar biosynthesis/type III secretory pathway protein FliH